MNRATKTITAVFGVILGLSVINHGFFETLQGSTPTPGLIIQAIGPNNQFWIHGTEEAFSIIPNFLITGILAILVGIAIIIWSIWFVHKKFGSIGFILLFVLSFLVGGGVGQVVFFLPVWGLSTRINKPLTWWKKSMNDKVRNAISKLWPYTLTLASILFIFALEIAIFGIVPGMLDPEKKLYFCWTLLGTGWLTLLLTFVSGFAYDIETK